MINVLYINFASENFDGAVYSLMDLIKSVRVEVNPIVMLRTKGCVYDYFTQHGVECLICDFEEDLVGIPIKWHQYIRYAIRYFPRHISYQRKNIKCISVVSERLKCRDIKIVHINNTVMSVGFGIAKTLNAKCVWHLRGFMDLDFGWRPLRGWSRYKQDLLQSDAIIGITKSVLEHFVPLNSNNAYVISDAVRGIDDVCMIDHKDKYFLFCSAFLTKRKGCDFAVRAFAKSKLYEEGYRLKIIGKGEDRYAINLKAMVEELGLSESVDFVGLIDNVKEYMERATAFLMCSENEGLGRVSIEAMFYGCLVIGRNSGGTKDILVDNETGYLFDDVDGCAKAMHKAIRDNNKKIIENAQRYACDNFSRENYGRKILAVYDKLLNPKNV